MRKKTEKTTACERRALRPLCVEVRKRVRARLKNEARGVGKEMPLVSVSSSCHESSTIDICSLEVEEAIEVEEKDPA